MNSFNIRIAATQSYVPDSFRARFNGTFLMLTTFGSMLGNLGAGILGEFIPSQFVIAGTQVLNLVAICAIVWPGREHVKQIYNREV